MIEEVNNILNAFLDSINLTSQVSRTHYIERCLPVIARILNSKGETTVIDAGCGHAHESILFAALGANVIGIDLREDGCQVALDNISKYRAIFPSLRIELINRDLFVAMKSLRSDIIWVRQAISHIHPAEEFIELAYERLNQDGLLVINDSNAINPLVWIETAAEHWKCQKRLSWFVTFEYKDPVTNACVPYAVERTLKPQTVERMLLASGFEIESLDVTGYIPVSIASRWPQLTLMLESYVKKVPVISKIGMEYVIVGKKQGNGGVSAPLERLQSL